MTINYFPCAASQAAAGAGGSVALWDAAGDDGAAAAWLAAQVK